MASKGNDTITKRLHLEIDAQVNGLQDAIASSQKALNSLKMPEANKLGYEQQFKSMESTLDKLKQKLAQGVANPKEYEQIGKEISKLEVSYNGLLRKVAELNDLGKTGKIRLLPDGERTVQTLRKMEEAATKYKNGLKSLENSQKALNLEISSNQLKELKGQQQIIEEYNKRKQKVDELKEQIEALENANNVKNYTNDGKYTNVLDFDATKLKRQLAAQKGYLTRAEGALGNLNPDDLDKINNEIEKLEVNIKKIQDELAQKKATLFTNLKADIANIKDVQIDPKSINSVEELEAAIQSLTGEKLTKAQGLIDDFKNSTGQLDKALKEVKNGLESAGPELTEFSNRTRDLDMLKSRIQYMFGLAGAMQLVRRTFTKAIGTIKELDAAMTETAVVTDYTVSDLWNNINKYTEMGNKVGVSIKGVYEATTLYYQQGLKTDQVFQLTEHTLKMARIAGLDAAEATDRMTNALRGFNMELNETSAQKVADVYSNLAAKTASNVDELSTAMTKVASLANNAGASFENTSAFLAQIIETTRESAETAGTALKTVIARFTEMKKNPLEIQDVEGEEVNVNKVEEALRSVGIMLRDTNGQIRDFDDIILELSGKWNGLSVNTQRYIATIAAGSRQQSRFIALLSDNARLTQLVNDANNAAGASSEQFAKTTESLKTKLQQLENAWNQFILGLTNSTIIKGAVDLLTDFLNVINGLTKSLPGLVKNVSNFFLAFGAFKGLKGIANIFGLAMNEASLAKSGGQMGTAFVNSLKNSIVKGGKGVAKSLKNIFNKNAYILPKGTVKSLQDLSNFSNMNLAKGAADSVKILKQQSTEILKNKDALNLYINATKLGMSTQNAANLIDTTNIEVSRQKIAAQLAGTNATEEEIASQERLLMVSNQGLLTKAKYNLMLMFGGKEARKAAFENLGLAASEAAAAKMADTYTFATFKAIAASKGLSAAIMSIPFIGWILAVIAALTALIALLANIAKNNSLEEKLKKQKEIGKDLSESYSKLRDDIDNLKSSWDELSGAKDVLDGLTIGTTAWKEQVEKVNGQVRELLNKYPLLRNFVNKQNGVLSINEQGYRELLKEMESGLAVTSNAIGINQLITANLERDRSERSATDKIRVHATRVSDDGKNISDYNANQFSLRVFGDFDKIIQSFDWDKLYDNEYILKWLTNLQKEKLSINNPSFNIENFDDKLYQNLYTNDEIENIRNNLKEYNDSTKEANDVLTAFSKTIQVTDKDLLNFSINGKKVSDEYIGVVTKQLSKSYTEKSLKEFSEGSGVGLWGIDKGLQEGTKGSAGIMEYITKYNKKHGTNILTGTSQEDAIYRLLSAYTGISEIDLKQKYTKEDDAARVLTQYIAAEDLSDRLSKTFEEMEKLTIDQQKMVMGIMSGTGLLLSKEDQQKFYKNSIFDINNYFQEIGDSIESMAASVGMDVETFKEEFGKQALIFDSSIKQITNLQNKYSSNFKDAADSIYSSFEKAIGPLDIQTELDLNKKLEQITLGGGDVTGFSQIISDLLNQSVTDEAKQSLLQMFTTLTGDTTSIYNFSKSLQDLGFNLGETGITGFNQQLIDLFKNIKAVDMSTLISSLKETYELSNDLAERDDTDRKFSEEDYRKLVAAGANREDFVYNGVDYTYVGESMDDLRSAIEANTLAQLEQNRLALKGSVERGETLENIETSYWINDNGTWKKSSEAKDLKTLYEEDNLGYVTGELFNSIATSLGYDPSNYKTNTAQNNALKKWVEEDLLNLDTNRADLIEQGQKSEQLIYTRLDSGQKILDKITTEKTDDLSLATKALIDDLASEDGLLTAYEGLAKAYGAVTDGQKVLLRAHVVDLNKAGKKVDNLKEKWNDVKDIIANSGKGTTNYIYAMEKLSKAGAQVFGEGFSKALEEDTTGAFYKWVKTWLEGGSGAAEAYKEIQNQLLKESNINNNFINQLLGMDIDTTISIPLDVKLSDEDIEKLREIGFVISALNGERIASRGGWNGSISSLLGGGSGSGSDTETPERAFDWLYNLTAYINKEMRERNKLEKEYNLLLSREGTTVADIHKNLQDRINLLAQESAYQQQMIDKRVQEREQLLKEAAQDNVTKYFDFVNGRPQIRFEQLDKLRTESPKLYELVQQYESKFNEINDEIESAEDAIYDNTSEIEELRNQGRDDFIDLEQTIFDAIVELRENEIKKLEEVNDSINDTNSSLISAIQKQLNKERQSRQNAEKETQIQNKELQLSYLQQSTDADPLKVKQLQEELANLREDYTDTLIDQKINELEEQNEAAKTQRDRQISILNDQLEQDKESGKIWEEVNGYMMNLGQTDGSVDNIKELLSNTKEYFTKSDTGKGKFFEDLTSQILSAGAWQKGFSLPVTATLSVGENFNEIPTNISNIAGNIQDIKNGLTDGTLPKVDWKSIAEKTSNESTDIPISNMYAEQWARGKTSDEIASKLKNNYAIDDKQLKLAGLAMINGEDIYLQKDFSGQYYLVKRLRNGSGGGLGTEKNRVNQMFATGGLSTETGPAWLDGTPSHPEYVLNPIQTQAFLQLPDLLQQLTNSGAFSTTQSTQSEINGDNYYEINLNVERIDSDYSVDRMAERVKEIIVSDAHYRNVNAVNLLR